jgi:phospholipid N-methyltransferase
MDKLLKECQVMAESTDVIVESLVLSDLSNDKAIRVLELGAGSGGWPRIMNKLGAKNIDWVLLEDFSWIKTGYASSQYYWPYDKEDFINFMNQLNPSVYIEELIDKNVDNAIYSHRLEQYENTISAVRIDCDITDKEAVYIIENCLTDNGIIIIDDCKINCGITRIELLLSLIKSKHAFPVWFGSKEAMICKSKEFAFCLQNLIADQIDKKYKDSNIFYNKEYKIIKGDDWNFITTNNFKVFVGK